MAEEYKDRLIQIIKKIYNKEFIFVDILDIINDEKFLDYIHFNTLKILKTYSQTGKYDKNKYVVFLSMIIIGYLNYSGNFWEEVHTTYNKFTNTIKIVPDQKMESIIRNLISEYYQGVAIQARKINWILMQALVPQNYLHSYFEMLFEAYRYDFDGNLPDDDFELNNILKNFMSQISSKSYSSDDKFKSQMSNKSYMLITSTRDVMLSKTYKHNIIELTNNILRTFDQISKNYNFKPNDALDNLVFQWINQYEEYKFKKFEHGEKSRNKKQWFTTYELMDDQIYLITKTIFLPTDINYKNVKIFIKVDDQIVYANNKPEIIENEGLSVYLSSMRIPMKFSPFKFDLIFEGLEEQNYCENKDYYIFDNKGQHKISLSNNEPSQIIVPKQSKINLEVIKTNAFYKTCFFDNVINDYFKINDQIVSTYKISNSQLISNQTNDYYVDIYNKRYISYSGGITIVIPHNKYIHNPSIWINNKKHMYQMNQEKQNDVAIEIADVKLGINKIEIIDKNEDKTNNEIFDFFYDDSFHTKLEGNQIRIVSKIFDIDDKFEIKPNHITNNEYDLQCAYENNPATIHVFLWIPTISNNEKPFEKISNYLSYKDFEYYNIVYFRGINASVLEIYNAESKEMSIASTMIDNHIVFKLDIGVLITNYSNKNLQLRFKKENETIYFVDFLNYIKIQNEDLHIESTENKIFIHIEEFKGDTGLLINIKKDDIEYVDLKYINIINDIELEVEQGAHSYLLTFYDLTKNIYLFEKEIYVYTKFDLINSYYKIEEVALGLNWKENGIRQYKMDIDTQKRTYLYLSEYNEKNDMYKCELFYVNAHGDKIKYRLLENIYIEIVEKIKTPQKIIINAYINQDDEEVLFYDIYKHRIIDIIEEPKNYPILATIDELIIKKEDNL